ncbi:MAG: hypothetical protein H6672_21745 [Anaerolineaceae bacterium]|nr:hypothetical protein [Anaerolineaceae bacterium]
MNSRIVKLVLALMLVLILVPAVSAQDDLACMGLSADDCAILQAASANSANMTSFIVNFKFNMALTGLAMLAPGAGDISISADGAGPIAFDEAMAMSDNPYGALTMAMDANGSFSDGTSTDGGSASFVIVDGNFYLQDPTSGQWIGFNLQEVVESGILEQNGIPFSPEMLMGGGGAPSAADATAALSMLGLSESDVAGLSSIPGFITNARLADESMMEQTMYPFTTTLDFAPLFASAEFDKLMNSILQLAAADDPSVAQFGPMVTMLLQNSQLTISTGQWIGANDMFVHRFTFDINAVIDLSALAGAAGGASGGNAPSLPPINFDVHLEMDFNEINVPVNVVAPEGATIVPASSLMSDLGN